MRGGWQPLIAAADRRTRIPPGMIPPLSPMPKPFVSLLALAFCAGAAFSASAATTTPAETVTSFHAVLIDNMKAGATLKCSGRAEKVGAAVDADFDLPFLAQRVLRRQWKDLSEEQRAQFIATFRELVLATYASQFAKFGGEKFETRETKDLADGTRLVNAKLTPGSGAPVNFDYVLREVPESGKGWRIINVVADGVSDLAIRASQYDKIYKASGFDGLIKQIKQQTEANKAGC